MKKFLFILFNFLLISNCFAQVTLQWRHVYKGIDTGGYYPSEMAVDDSGNVFITGASIAGFYSRTTHLDFTTLKYNSNGVLLWSRAYGDHGDIEDYAWRLVIDMESNVYVTGLSYDTIINKTLCVTIKYNSSGELQWINKFSDLRTTVSSFDYLGLVTDDSQNVYVSYNSYGSYSGYAYASNLLKYNSNGSLVWRKRFEGDVNIQYTCLLTLCLDESGNIYVGGFNVPRGTFVRKYNPLGELIWTGFYPKFVYFESMDVDSTGSVYAIGSGDSTRILRFANNGEFMWTRAFKKDYNMNYRSRKKILIGRDNKILSAFPVRISSYNDDIFILKMNSSGGSIWERTYAFDSSSYENTSALVEDERGNVYVSGYSLSVIGGLNYEDTYVILQYTSTGEIVRIIRKAGTEPFINYQNIDMVLDNNRNIILTGHIEDSVFYDSGLTFKLVQPVGVTKESNRIPLDYVLHQNYPNPFNPTTNIKFDLKKSSHTKLIIYDILGKEVATPVNEKLSAGSYEVSWDGTGYPSGVYFYKLVTEDYVDTKKMLLIK